jgi:site-specific recombinase XerD
MTTNDKPVEALVEEFRQHLQGRDLSTHSIRAYLSDLRRFAAWFTEHTGVPFALEAATEYDVRDWRDHLAATMKPATVNRKLAALSALSLGGGNRAI